MCNCIRIFSLWIMYCLIYLQTTLKCFWITHSCLPSIAVALKYETFERGSGRGWYNTCVSFDAMLSGDWLAGLNPNSVFFWNTLLRKASTSMEPSKIQPEGGLNVTLTIRLLMHGKVGATESQCGPCCHDLLSLETPGHLFEIRGSWFP